MRITGIPCQTELTPQGNIAFVAQAPLEALFVFVTATPSDAIRNGEAHLGENTPKYGNLLVMPRELCAQCLRITF